MVQGFLEYFDGNIPRIGFDIAEKQLEAGRKRSQVPNSLAKRIRCENLRWMFRIYIVLN